MNLVNEVRQHFDDDQRVLVLPAGDKVEARVNGILLFTVWHPGGERSLYLASMEGVEGKPQTSLHGALISALHEAESADWNSRAGVAD